MSSGRASSSIPPLDQLQPKTCYNCRQYLAPDTPYKSCTKCREKARERNARKALEKREEAIRQYEKFKVPELESGITTMQQSKRKSHEVEPENREEAMERLTKRYKTAFKNLNGETAAPVKAPVVDPPAMRSQEFQTASGLYLHLKTNPLRPNASFSLCHSIIASPAIDNPLRARLVAKDLKALARLPFDKDSATSPSNHDGRHQLIFRCQCSVPSAPAPQSIHPVGTSVAAHRQPGLSKFMRLGMNRANEYPPTACHGKIVVTAQDDMSHPLEIKGQKITVTISHTEN